MDRNLLAAFALSMAVFIGWIAWQQQIQAEKRDFPSVVTEPTAESQEADRVLPTQRGGWNESNTPSYTESVDI